MGAEALRLTSIEVATSQGSEDVDRIAFNGPLSASMHLLIGYGFELNLKAMFLLHKGDETQLWRGPKAIGHDLIAAIDAAESVGFRTSILSLRWVLENLRDSHLAHHWRYGGAPSITIPALETSLPVLQQLTREVKRYGMKIGVIL